jgi:hypothetical protein
MPLVDSKSGPSDRAGAELQHRPQSHRDRLLLGAFAKLRKATINFVMSVRLFVCPHGTTRLPLDGFSWNLIFESFSKICRKKIRVSLKSDKNKGYFIFLMISPSFLLRMRNVSDKRCSCGTHILCSTVFCFFENRAFYELMWKTLVQPERPQTIIRLKCISRGVTNKHSEYVTLVAFPLQQWLHERASILRYTYIEACLVNL